MFTPRITLRMSIRYAIVLAAILHLDHGFPTVFALDDVTPRFPRDSHMAVRFHGHLSGGDLHLRRLHMHKWCWHREMRGCYVHHRCRAIDFDCSLGERDVGLGGCWHVHRDVLWLALLSGFVKIEDLRLDLFRTGQTGRNRSMMAIHDEQSVIQACDKDRLARWLLEIANNHLTLHHALGVRQIGEAHLTFGTTPSQVLQFTHTPFTGGRR